MKRTFGVTWGKIGRLTILASVAITLAGCEEGKTFNPFKPKAQADGTTVASQRPGKSVERDVEAPELFHKTESGLWDGRPSLGGVWVAHPDVKEPLRVIIRNEANGKSITGALFRRERENPGPRIQVSSDAASELKMLAGQPVKLDIVALRREKVEEVAPEPAPEPVPETAPTKETLDTPEAIEEKPLDPIASAAAAIDAAEGKPVARPTPPTPKPAAAPAVAPSKLAKPYVQLGTFGSKENADKVIEDMRKVGLFATANEQTSNGKTVWRVLVGPAGRRAERTAMLRKVKSMGFKDAYIVSN
ncbi:SPOR domain-containing protein [Profundibacter amoris]|uniref:SPOR domain-containing protein n=1 Tax=Profundibacter amoris TaxID=2171755 RepID=A0A347UIJ3_9RHOB|nr:SPOR domain-containing protein [Profundibacter amoris]AXX98671.1 SPOR domain-containing protein [Profundibacter amoris]